MDEARAFADQCGAHRLAEVKAYINEVYRLARLVGLDPSILIAQSAHETGNWSSHWWMERLNPAGIGITGAASQNAASRTWTNGLAAAASHVAHMYLYAVGDLRDSAVDGVNPDADPRYAAFLEAFRPGFAQTLASLTKTWATDKEYADKVAAKGNVIFPHLDDAGGTPVAITFGNVPKPFERRIIDKDAGWRWGERTIRGVCLHSMVGYLWGTETYFSTFNHAIPGGGHGWNALTDFGVGGSMDPNLDGAVWMWNEPAGNRVPFANGWGDEGPGLEGDGPGYVDRYGVGAVNSDLISIERSDGGDINSPVSAKQFEAVCQTAAWVIDQARIPWTTWPKNNDGAQAIYWHSEFALKACPFGPMEGRTTAIIDRVRDILKHFQEGGAAPPKEPKYAKPDKPPAYDGTDKTVNGVIFRADKRTVKVAVEGLNCRKWAGTDAPLTRSPMKQGKGFGVRYWITGENVDGEDRWWVTAAGSRVWVGGTVQQPSRDRGLPAGARGEAAASSAWG